MAAETWKKGRNEKEDIRGETAYSTLERSFGVRKAAAGEGPYADSRLAPPVSMSGRDPGIMPSRRLL